MKALEKPLSESLLLQEITETIRQTEPTAEVILYGSRARGDATPESDWDLLILVDGPAGDDRKDAIRHRLYEIEWASGRSISSIIFSRQEWNSSTHRAMPFRQSVEREGRAL